MVNKYRNDYNSWFHLNTVQMSVHCVYLAWPSFYPELTKSLFPCLMSLAPLSHSNQWREIDHSITTRHG